MLIIFWGGVRSRFDCTSSSYALVEFFSRHQLRKFLHEQMSDRIYSRLLFSSKFQCIQVREFPNVLFFNLIYYMDQYQHFMLYYLRFPWGHPHSGFKRIAMMFRWEELGKCTPWEGRQRFRLQFWVARCSSSRRCPSSDFCNGWEEGRLGPSNFELHYLMVVLVLDSVSGLTVGLAEEVLRLHALDVPCVT